MRANLSKWEGGIFSRIDESALSVRNIPRMSEVENTANETTQDGQMDGQDVNEMEGAQEVDTIQALAEESARWRDVAMRGAADFDNFRKRVARDREEAMRYANQGLLEELLPILDNFEMGMLAASADTTSMIYIGMDMVRKQFADFLSNLGVEEVPALGLPFDPNLQEAISEEASDKPPGTVLRVTRRGFKLKDRLLRPANVVVAKDSAEEKGSEDA
jgi:molecular chaperone GrpE